MTSILSRLAAASLAMASLALGSAAALHAESATLTCTGSSGSSLVLPISAFHADTNSSFVFLFSVQSPLSYYNQVLTAEYFGGNYANCSINPGNGTTFGTATIVDVTADVNASEQVVTTSFSFTSLFLGPSTASVSAAGKDALSEAQKQEAVQHYLDRLPQVMKSK